MNQIFKKATNFPDYDSHVLIQYENGNYVPIFYWSFGLKTLKLLFKGTKETGPAITAIRWCYCDDLDKLK